MTEQKGGYHREDGPTEKAGERRFARLAVDGSPQDGRWPVPPDGLCLSSFVLLSPADGPGEVLVGKFDPSAPWGTIGALDPRRAELNSTGWMLPSSHLLYFEAPRDAAQRILREQLGISNLRLEGPEVFSEVYPAPRHPGRLSHWDLEFVFRGVTPRASLRHPAWRELRFVNPLHTPRSAFTRSHDEVLELAGYRFP